MKRFLILIWWMSAAAFAEELKVTDGKFTEAQPMQQQDRMEGSKAAAKAAAAGAAMGKVNCMMMMNEAMKEKDKKTKMMMMMMANQACMQAAEMEKSAAENDKGRKALTMNDIPKQAKFTAGKVELQGEGPAEAKLSYDDNAPARTGTDKGEITLAKQFMPDISNQTASPGKTEPDTTQTVTETPAAPGGALNPIENGKLQFDDSQKAAATTGAFGPSMASLSPGFQSSNANAPSAQQAAAPEGPGKGEKSRGISSEAGPGASGSDSDSTSSSGGSATFDALMSQLMPGEAAGEEVADTSTIAIWNKNENDTGERANIFEYATIRYRRLSIDDKRLGGKLPHPPDRALASAKP